MKRVAADENLHYLFYRDLVSAALEVDPSGMIEAIKRQTLRLRDAGGGDTGLRRARQGHRPSQALRLVPAPRLDPEAGHPGPLGRGRQQGLTPSAEAARDRLVQFITRMGRAAARLQRPRAEAVGAASP